MTFEATRQVNGTELLCLQIKGTIQGVAFIYFGYYYSSDAGTVQMITYTGQNLFEEFQSDFEEFLNGRGDKQGWLYAYIADHKVALCTRGSLMARSIGFLEKARIFCLVSVQCVSYRQWQQPA